MQIIDEQCREDARAHIDHQHAQCAQLQLDDRAEGVKRQHIEEQVTAISMSEVRKKHALIILPAETSRGDKKNMLFPAKRFIFEKPMSEMSTFIQ